MKRDTVSWVALILLIIGGLNWGLVGLFNFNLVSFLFGGSLVGKLIYILVGISAIWAIIKIKKL